MFDGNLKTFFDKALTDRKLHITSFDPARHSLERAKVITRAAMDADTDAFFLGGSTGVDNQMVEQYGSAIRHVILERFPAGPRPPMILFPSSAATGVSTAADGVLFHSLLNSNDVRYLIREQAKAAPYLPALGLQPIGCGMICIEPGGTASTVGKADLIARDDWQQAVGYAAAAAAFGFPLIYLNAGSGSDQPVPPGMIAATKQVVSAPLIVGGGITDATKALAAVSAGADVIITGTAIEGEGDVANTLREIITAVHSVAPREGKGE